MNLRDNQSVWVIYERGTSRLATQMIYPTYGDAYEAADPVVEHVAEYQMCAPGTIKEEEL